MDCSYLHEIRNLSSDYLEKSLLNSVLQSGMPIAGGIELTARCNLECIHCYNLPYTRSTFLKYSDIRNIVDQMAAAGVFYLFITGGEPLLRRDFVDIYTYIKRKGILTSVFTNGTLITDDICKVFQEYPPISVEITLYGATEKTYAQITNVKGSYKKCLNGIERLKAANVNISLKTVLMKNNCHELELCKNFAEQIGARFRYSTLIFPRINGDTDVLNLRLSPEQVSQYDIEDADRRKAWVDFLEENKAPSKEESSFLYMCGAALTTFHIDHSGNLCACVRERTHSFDLTKLSFLESWRRLTHIVRNITSSEQYRCKDCRFIMVCDQCPAMSRNETGNPEYPGHYICETGKLRGIKLQVGKRRW